MRFGETLTSTVIPHFRFTLLNCQDYEINDRIWPGDGHG